MLSPLIHNRLLRLMSYRQTPQNLSGFPLSKIDVEDIQIVLKQFIESNQIGQGPTCEQQKGESPPRSFIDCRQRRLARIVRYKSIIFCQKGANCLKSEFSAAILALTFRVLEFGHTERQDKRGKSDLKVKWMFSKQRQSQDKGFKVGMRKSRVNEWNGFMIQKSLDRQALMKIRNVTDITAS